MSYTIKFRNKNTKKVSRLICTAGYLEETVDRLKIYGYEVMSVALKDE